MTNENNQIKAQTENDDILSEPTELTQESTSVDSEDVLELTDDREYPNQINMLRDIAHIYSHLTPSNKKIVRLSIARTA